MKTRSSRSTVLAAAIALLALAACGGGGNDTTAGAADKTTNSAPETSAASPTEEAMTATKPFGPGCSAVPADGAGSFDGMAQEPVATAASNNPVLSTLVTAVSEADLVDTLNSAEDITVFAPTNDAFKAMDQKMLNKAMKDPKGLLTQVLGHHVVAGKLSPDQLPGTHKTLQGGELTVEGSGEDFTVDGTASVVCGNVQTANATVYIIDGVLMPQM